MKRDAVIVSSHFELLAPLVEAAGYEVAGAADTAFNGENIIGHVRPDVVVIENELVGEQGWEAIPHLRDVSPDSKIVLVVADGFELSDIGSVGAFVIVWRREVATLVQVLSDLDSWIDRHEIEGTVQSDRRRGRDRRVAQDWSKVGWERRKGDRRKADVRSRGLFARS